MAQKQKYKLLDGGKSEKSRKKSASGKKKKKSSGKAAGYSYAVATPGEWLRANLGVLIASIAIVCLAAIASSLCSCFGCRIFRSREMFTTRAKRSRRWF